MYGKKSLGQHFLMHPQIADRIAKTAELTNYDVAFEIGPGKGMLTRALLRYAGKVIALEADALLAAHLEKEFAPEIAAGRLTILFGDIRTFDLTKLPSPYALVANIPYYLTGDILRKFLSGPNQPSSMTLLVQKEVAVRIARAKKESIVSLSVKAYGEPSYVFTVSRGSFVPAPKVDSAVLKISKISRAQFASPLHEKRFFELVKAGFAHKRKYVSSNLKSLLPALSEQFTKKRAEDLSLADWLTLAHKE